MSRRFRTAIVGGGAAGTAVLVAASKSGRLHDLARDLVVIDRSDRIGAGRLGAYAITSDSTATTFLSAVVGNPVPALRAIAQHPAALAVAAWQPNEGVPLALAGRFLDVVGETLAAEITAAGGALRLGAGVRTARRLGDVWRIECADGEPIEAERLVVATGASQPLDRLAAAHVAGEPLVALAAGKLVQSDEVLAHDGLRLIGERLGGRAHARIVIVGGSTSALTAANRLLRHPDAPAFAENGLTVLHRRPLRPFYASLGEAQADGVTDVGPDDICPVSGFVFRFAGLRLDARELVRRQLGLAGTPDMRMRLHRIAPGRDERALRLIADADLVIAALGYRPRALTIEDGAGRPILLRAEAGAMVDDRARIVRAGGEPLPDAWGIGLAAGYRPSGAFGGEASFSGQVNGLWLWQNGVGDMIVDQLLGAADRQVAA